MKIVFKVLATIMFLTSLLWALMMSQSTSKLLSESSKLEQSEEQLKKELGSDEAWGEFLASTEGKKFLETKEKAPSTGRLYSIIAFAMILGGLAIVGVLFTYKENQSVAYLLCVLMLIIGVAYIFSVPAERISRYVTRGEAVIQSVVTWAGALFVFVRYKIVGRK